MTRSGMQFTETDVERLLGDGVKRKKLPQPIIKTDRYDNKWERDYAQYLNQLRHLHEILFWNYHDFGFRLAGGCFFYPDFFITCPDHFEVHDVKGFMRDDAHVKLKMGKELWPYFRWAYTRKIKGRWEIFYI
jgi:hypothetical protein